MSEEVSELGDETPDLEEMLDGDYSGDRPVTSHRQKKKWTIVDMLPLLFGGVFVLVIGYKFLTGHHSAEVAHNSSMLTADAPQGKIVADPITAAAAPPRAAAVPPPLPPAAPIVATGDMTGREVSPQVVAGARPTAPAMTSAAEHGQSLPKIAAPAVDDGVIATLVVQQDKQRQELVSLQGDFQRLQQQMADLQNGPVKGDHDLIMKLQTTLDDLDKKQVGKAARKANPPAGAAGSNDADSRKSTATRHTSQKTATTAARANASEAAFCTLIGATDGSFDGKALAWIAADNNPPEPYQIKDLRHPAPCIGEIFSIQIKANGWQVVGAKGTLFLADN